MKTNSRRTVTPICLGAIAVLLMACGKDSGNSSHQNTSAQEEVEGIGPSYRAQLRPLNNVITENAVGIALWSVKGSDYTVQLNMTNTPDNLEHFQAVHEGSACPDEGADKNQDGIIDGEELKLVSGKILFPLDSNLNSKNTDDFSLSRANDFGNYIYWSKVGIKTLEQLYPRFQPSGKAVVVYGVNPQYALPGTISGSDVNKHRYIPISCGVIRAANPQKVY